MRLRRVLIQNFRGVRHLDLELDQVTVLIAESNHGKSSFFDVLGLCLGVRGANPESCFREGDFFADPDDDMCRIRIVLTFEGTQEGQPERLHLEVTGARTDRLVHRRFVDEEGCPLDPQPDPSTLERLHGSHPVLMLRFARSRQQAGQVGEVGKSGAERRGPPTLAATIAQVYNDLAQARGPVPEERIEHGLEAAYRLLGGGAAEGSPGVPAHRMLDELRAEVRRWGRPKAADAGLDLSGSGSHNLALLLVLGSILEAHGEGAFDSATHPIIAIEEPESHLHPILLASTWDVIEALDAQTVVTTNSGELLSSVPISRLRRLVRSDGHIDVHRLREGSLTSTDLRRVAYHIRAKRGGVLFSRCWMLIEGESEFWLMRQLAEVLGYDLEAEGVQPIEFAQCGVAPLAKLANDLGIPWHLLADGDEAGSVYARDAAEFLAGRPAARRISKLGHRDIELCLWHHGFEDVYRRAARIADRPDGNSPPPRRIISKAVRKKSKPYLALAVAEAAAERGRRSIPPVLREVIEATVALAREVTERGAHRP